MDPTQEYWEVFPESVVIMVKNSTVFVGNTLSHKLSMYIVNMHNSMLDRANVQPFCYDTLISELRGSS